MLLKSVRRFAGSTTFVLELRLYTVYIRAHFVFFCLKSEACSVLHIKTDDNSRPRALAGGKMINYAQLNNLSFLSNANIDLTGYFVFFSPLTTNLTQC